MYHPGPIHNTGRYVAGFALHTGTATYRVQARYIGGATSLTVVMSVVQPFRIGLTSPAAARKSHRAAPPSRTARPTGECPRRRAARGAAAPRTRPPWWWMSLAAPSKAARLYPGEGAPPEEAAARRACAWAARRRAMPPWLRPCRAAARREGGEAASRGGPAAGWGGPRGPPRARLSPRACTRSRARTGTPLSAACRPPQRGRER
mmetsp:Transcript_21556/g.68604  ORF Transcript_21556/g.68604 Transcript_21556/m.68604 type:complete len:205 (-) Transcript_21556:667-1281(-)